jgi:hypothetical protein
MIRCNQNWFSSVAIWHPTPGIRNHFGVANNYGRVLGDGYSTGGNRQLSGQSRNHERPITYNSPGTYTIHWTYDDGHGTLHPDQTVIVKTPGPVRIP